MAGKSNNELLIKVVEETAAQKQSLEIIGGSLAEIRADLKRVISMTEKLHHTIYGNGETGLVERVEALEEWRGQINETIHEAKGGGRVVAFLFGLASAMIGFFAERIFK